MGKLVVVPTAGLANRMRMVATAYKLAYTCRRDLEIYWCPDIGLNAAWSELFEFPFLSVKGKIELRKPVQYILLSLAQRDKRLSFMKKWLFKNRFVYTDNMAEMVWKGEI